MTPSQRRPPQTYIMKVSWSIDSIPIAYTKILLIHLCFYLFCPNSLFQTPILFCLRPGDGLRRSRWPCQPGTTLRRAHPNGVPPRGAIQGDRREFAQYVGADVQTVRRPGLVHWWSDHLRRSVRLLAPDTEALGPVSGTRGCIRVTAVKLQRQHTFWLTPLGRISG
jgi:hypothetical protein